MQRMEVSCAVRHIYVVSRLRVKHGFAVHRVVTLMWVNVRSFRLNIKSDIVLCRCGGESLLLEAGNLQRRNYWLRRLRQERRSFAGRCMYLVQHRELWPHFDLRGLVGVLYVTQSKDIVGRDVCGPQLAWTLLSTNPLVFCRFQKPRHYWHVCIVAPCILDVFNLLHTNECTVIL
jgi:hypothetical protein